jgi:hypothetical protein
MLVNNVLEEARIRNTLYKGEERARYAPVSILRSFNRLLQL